MNQTMDCFGTDNLIIHERPFTISYIDENSPQKFSNLSQLFANQNKKRNQRQSGRSLQYVTLRDYCYQTYIPTRSPPSLQIQLLNQQQHTSKSTNSRKNNFSKQQGTKCKTLPLNEFNYNEIQKTIELKKIMLEKLYLVKDNCKTQKFKTEKTEEACQTQKLQNDLFVQSNKISKKNQEIQTYRPFQSRGLLFQKNQKINTFQAMPLSLGLRIEKCKIVERLNHSPFQDRNSLKRKNQKNNSIGDKQQKIVIQKPIIKQVGLKKKSSIPVAKWDYSDFEYD
ncbi:unnamed protein product [Paramecium sonneborni]|uniref:Uncharacterized protein n=1 Tax=Paramecium sonneborni TaxID=65129 RepID=A0A8S1MGZ3_9CILI|nr:unnamed protein product [Paramecium sonneborni]